jgi:hypothetical protein
MAVSAAPWQIAPQHSCMLVAPRTATLMHAGGPAHCSAASRARSGAPVGSACAARIEIGPCKLVLEPCPTARSEASAPRRHCAACGLSAAALLGCCVRCASCAGGVPAGQEAHAVGEAGRATSAWQHMLPQAAGLSCTCWSSQLWKEARQRSLQGEVLSALWVGGSRLTARNF